MVARAKITGAKRMRRKLAGLPSELRNQVGRALDKTADEIVATAKRLAPKDTGAGAAAIGKRDGEHELQRVVYAADDDTFYLRFQEFGAEDQPAQPFFFPAYRLNRKRGQRRIKTAVNKALRKDAGL